MVWFRFASYSRFRDGRDARGTSVPATDVAGQEQHVNAVHERHKSALHDQDVLTLAREGQ